MGVGESVVGRKEGDEGGLKREILESDLAVAGRGGGMDEGRSGLGSDRNLEGEIRDGEAHERARIHEGKEM